MGCSSGVSHDGGVRRRALCDRRARDDHDGTARLAHRCGDVVQERGPDRPVAVRTDEEQIDHAVRSAGDLLCGHAVDELPLGLRDTVLDRDLLPRSWMATQARRRSRRSGQRGVRARATQPRGARRRPRASRRGRRRSGECHRRCTRAAPPPPGTGRRGAGAPGRPGSRRLRASRWRLEPTTTRSACSASAAVVSARDAE